MTAKNRGLDGQCIVQSKTAIIYTLIKQSRTKNFIPVPLELKSRYTQRVYDVCFKMVSDTYYTIYELMPYVSDQFSDAVGQVLTNELEEARSYVKSKHKELQVKAEKLGVSTVSSAEQPRNVVAKIHTPMDMKYVEAIRELDAVIELVSALWIMGAVPNRQKKNVIQECQKRIMGVAFDAHDMGKESVKKIADQQINAKKLKEEREKVRQERKKKQAELKKKFDTTDSDTQTASAEKQSPVASESTGTELAQDVV